MLAAQRLSRCLMAFALGGCLSGQTGSPDCVGPINCICDPLYAPGPLLRVHGESADASGNLVAVVDEVFPLHSTDIRVGDRVGGSIIREKSCDLAYHTEPLVGAELFVMFFPDNFGGYANCKAFQACAAAHCEGLAEPALTDCWNTCNTRVDATCDSERHAALLDGAFSWVIPWADTLDFGGSEHQLLASDMAVLENNDTCEARFPTQPAPPCQVTINGGVCTVSAPAPERPDEPTWLGIVAVLGLGVGARRYKNARRSRTR